MFTRNKFVVFVIFSFLFVITVGCIFNPKISSQQNENKQTEGNIIPQEKAQEQKNNTDITISDDPSIKQPQEASLVVKNLDEEIQQLQKITDFTKWNTFDDPAYNFQFKYPSDWKVEKYDKNSINLVSPELQKQLSQPSSNLKGNLFMRVYDSPDEAPYISKNTQEDLLEAEKDFAIYQLKFYSDTHAQFIEKNELFDDYNIVHYFVLPQNKLLEIIYIYGDKNHTLAELISQTITYK